MQRSRKNSFLKKYINGTKGVISLFLAILMIPFATIAGALINAGRINSAVAIFDEALCNASNSTLGTYDDFIRSRFALMAMSQDTSSGGTEFGEASADYATDDFVNDLFCYYMEQNLESLNNTYSSPSLTATGLYPLADPVVLKSSVLQASKIVVPAKLVVDWGSLDDMLAQLTHPLGLISSFESTLSSGMTVVSDIDKLTEKQEALEKQIESCNTARTEYETAYTSFKNAAQQFNILVDNINTWSVKVADYQVKFDELEAKVKEIDLQIAEKEQTIEDLEKDKETDYTDKIKEIQKEIKTLKEDSEIIIPDYNEMLENLNSAKATLESYTNQFSSKRTSVVSEKSNYYDKIVVFRDAVNTTSSLAIAFQNAAKSLVNDSVGFLSDMTSTGLAISKASVDKQKEGIKAENEYYSYQKTLADKGGYLEESTHYYNLIQENQSTLLNLDETKLKYENSNAVVGDAVSALEGVSSGLTDFANRDLVGEYRVIYEALDELRIRVNERTVPLNYAEMTYSDLYFNVINPVEKADVSTIVENIEDQIVNNGGWAVLKVIVSFLKAMLKISLDHDPELVGTINADYYSGNGGLPSKIDRDANPLTSEYDDEDAALSEQYKTLLNSYSLEDVYEAESEGMSAIEEMMGHIDTLQELIDPFKLKNLSKMWDAATGLFKSLLSIGADFVTGGISSVATGIGNKILIVGYISYNTANRTTFTGKALSGASYSLPAKDVNTGYCFSGAETEYIFKGSMSEKTNQIAVFRSIWAERLLFDVAAVLGDATIQTIATTIGSFTFGIGTFVTYAVCLAAEAFVDAVILGNGGDIPILKSFVYITPTGIPKLLQQVFSLKLSEAVKQSIYEKASNCAYELNKGVQDFALEHGKYAGDEQVELPKYSDYKAEQDQLDNEFKNIFNLDYTKSLQIIMLLTGNTNRMIGRLADIIQMEASYKATQGTATYNFNLDKSYTYIRAAGSFTSNVFIKIGDDDSVTSKSRVIYNGY